MECNDNVCERIPVPENPKEDLTDKKLCEIPVFDNSEKRIEFGNIIKGKNSLIIFMRHTGWNVCLKEVNDNYIKLLNELEDYDIKLVLISPGKASTIPDLKTRLKIEGKEFDKIEIYADPSQSLYQYTKMTSVGFLKLMEGEGIKKSKEATKDGFSVGFSFSYGSMKQLGGVILFSKSGNELYKYNCEKPYDYPKLKDIPLSTVKDWII